MPKKILVADDSITIQKIVAMAFEKEDIIVEGVSNGKEAFDRMGDFLPDIVLADIDMPGLTGFELSKKIKADAEFDSTKVLLLASDFEDFNEKLYTASGADDHISKPFKSDDIVKKVTDLLSEGASAPVEVAIKLSAADMDEKIVPAEAAVELSTDSMVEEGDPTFDLSESDMDEKVEPAEAAVELSTDSMVEEGDPTFDLSESDMDEKVEPAEAAVELSTDSMVEQEEKTIDTAKPDTREVVKPATATEQASVTETTQEDEEDVLDKMIKDVESLKEMTEPIDTYSDYDELSETTPTQEDEIGEELDTAFREIINFGAGQEPGDTPNIRREPITDPSAGDIIIPEPEDLLEKMTPSALARKKGISGPNLIQESLSYLSQITQEPKSRQAMASHRSERLKNFSQSMDTEDERFIRVVGERVKQILENSLQTSIEKEIDGLSNSITKSVREVIREITPGIAREIIKEEIDKIKKE